MANQPTSLPIQESVINDTKALAKELDISWDQLVDLALQDFIRRHRGHKQLTDKINAAYEGAPDDNEIITRQGMRTAQRKLVKGEW